MKSFLQKHILFMESFNDLQLDLKIKIFLYSCSVSSTLGEEKYKWYYLASQVSIKCLDHGF